ncbi:hypothetical protein TNCV_295331 [Trichonephila clavipes]|nr:hypothetical protein TNCV_295331 [Trichonephila clavipes]
MQAFGRLRRFSESTKSVEVDEGSEHPRTSCTAENIEKVSEAVLKNRLQTIEESVGISSVTFQWTLTKDLKMYRVCQHIVSPQVQRRPICG